MSSPTLLFTIPEPRLRMEISRTTQARLFLLWARLVRGALSEGLKDHVKVAHDKLFSVWGVGNLLVKKGSSGKGCWKNSCTTSRHVSIVSILVRPGLADFSSINRTSLIPPPLHDSWQRKPWVLPPPSNGWI